MNWQPVKPIVQVVLRFWLCVFVLPLLGNTPLLLNNRIVILMLLWGIGLIHQETMPMSRLPKSLDTTQGIIALGGYLVTVMTLIDFAYFKHTDVQGLLMPKIGLVVLIFGFILRGWSLYILGKYFSKTAEIQPEVQSMAYTEGG